MKECARTLHHVVVTHHTQIVRATNMQSIMEKIKKRRKNSMRKSENAKSNYRRRSA
jgi:23S rRNA maturation mini-RNase III